MSPLVSVIIPSYNGAQFLEQAVSSVINQTYKNLECIIVDDGSTDDTQQLCKNLIKNNSQIKYVYQRNGGPGSARNRGIKEAVGDWIQFLDADDWLNEDKIRFQLDYFHKIANNANENVVLFSDYNVITVDSHQNIQKRVTQIIGNLSEEQILHRILSWNGEDDNCPLHTNSMLSKRSVFEKDSFIEAKNSGFEDLELYIRLIDHKVKFVYTPITGMYFRRHPKSLTQTDSKYTREGFVGFLEILYRRNNELLEHIPYIEKQIQLAFQRGDKERFDRLLKLNKRPVRLPIVSLHMTNRLALKLIFFLNFIKIKILQLLRSKT
jgi:glycosyltransferase involved in cell wall biosynthesis